MSLATQSTEQQETSVPRKHIILVEDDPNNAEALDLLLQTTSSYQLTSFRTGSETVANLDRIKSLSPVLFLLDYTLPHMTGLDLYKQLHTTEGLENVPTIVLSGSRISDDERDGMLQQRLIFIPKPYDIDSLLATIGEMIA